MKGKTMGMSADFAKNHPEAEAAFIALEAKGKVLAAQGKLAQAEAFVTVYEAQGEFFAGHAEAWRQVVAEAHADLMAAVAACESL